MSVADMILTLEARMTAYRTAEDPAMLVDPETLALEDRLYGSYDWMSTLGPTIVENAGAVTSALMVSTMAWYRITSDPDWDLGRLLAAGGRGAMDVTRATVLFRLVNRALPAYVPDELKPAYPEQPVTFGEDELHGMLNRSLSLLHEHERTGSVEALDNALVLVYYTILVGGELESVAVGGNNLLGSILTRKYEHRMDGALLDSAKLVLFGVVDRVPVGDHRRRPCLANLGHALIRSAERTGDGDELLAAVAVLRQATADAPDDDPFLAACLTNLCAALVQCFLHFRSTEALDGALDAIARAVHVTPADDRDLANRLANLGNVLLLRRRYLPDQGTLVMALRTYRRAMTGATGPNRWTAMTGIVSALVDSADGGHLREALTIARTAVDEIGPHRWEYYNAVLAYAKALDAAGNGAELVELLTRACGTVPPDHPERADVLGALGNALVAHDGDRDQAIALFLEASASPSAPLLERALAAASAAAQQAAAERYEVGAGTFGTALTLLESALREGLTVNDHERLLASAPALVNAAASCALDADLPERAVELLEQGRGLLLARAVGVEAVPGFDKLRTAAAQGPVVMVNVDGRRGDALVVRESGVEVVRLPALTLDEVAARVIAYAKALQDIVSADRAVWLAAREVVGETLAWLWTAIVEPVLKAVDEPRVWWCPTSLLTLFPLHAAGIYGPVPVSALDRVVSSYTPTLRALLHTRSRAPREASPFLIVSMPKTPGYPDLPDAEDAARMLADRFPDHELLTGDTATKASVAEALGRHSRAHIMCHGVQDIGAASAGGLVMHDGVLTVRDVMARRSAPGEVAFLAACVTAQSTLHLPNEVMTFAGALQLGSFRHVIGTVGPIDATATEFAEAFYGTDVHPDETAYRVHDVVQAIRRKYPLAPILWATYVHFGP